MRKECLHEGEIVKKVKLSHTKILTFDFLLCIFITRLRRLKPRNLTVFR